MSFRLEQHEAIPKGIERIVRECLKGATTALDEKPAASDADVHQARKCFKQARAAIRLVRDELGPAIFKRENRCIRDAARPLSEVRDAKVMIERLDMLTHLFEGRIDAEDVARLREELLSRRHIARNRALRNPDTLSSTLRQSRDLRKRLKRWPLHRRGWQAINGGLRSVYKRGRAAMHNVHAQPTDDALHEWRKRAKDLRYELQILRDIRRPVMKALANRAHRLTELLGEDHDLAVMRSLVTDISVRGLDIDARALIALIDQRRRTLQTRANAVGERVYKQKTGTFVGRLHGYWKSS